jgi:hypothetical protein
VLTWQEEHVAFPDGNIPKHAIIHDLEQHISLLLKEPLLPPMRESGDGTSVSLMW